MNLREVATTPFEYALIDQLEALPDDEYIEMKPAVGMAMGALSTETRYTSSVLQNMSRVLTRSFGQSTSVGVMELVTDAFIDVGIKPVVLVQTL